MKTTQTTLEGKTIPTASAPPPSAAGSFRVYPDATTGFLMLSIGAGPFLALNASLGGSSWQRDAALAPPQVEPINPGDVLAFSTASIDVPAGSKALIEGTPAVTGAVLELVATGQNSAPFPAPGAATLKASRNRNAAMGGVLEALTSVLIEQDNFAGDAVGSGDWGLLVLNNRTGGGLPSDFYNEGVVLIGDADGNGGIFDRALAVYGGPLWIGTYNQNAGLQAPDIDIFTFPNIGAGEPGGRIQLAVGDTNGIQPPNIEFLPGIDTAAVGVGPHGQVTITSRDAVQVPLAVIGSAAQSVAMQTWNWAGNPAPEPPCWINENGDLVHGVSGNVSGVPSLRLLQRCDANGTVREWQQYTDGENATDISHRYVLDPAGGNIFELGYNEVGAAFQFAAFFGGSGAQQSARPGQIADNSGGVSTGAVAAAPVVYAAANFDDIHATMLARINALEQKLKDLGLFI